MTQTQFLLFLIAIIPLLNCLVMRFAMVLDNLLNISGKIIPILYLLVLVILYKSIQSDDSYIKIAEAAKGISIGFSADKISLIFMSFLGFFWLIFAFYSQRFLQINPIKNIYDLKMFFLVMITLVNFVIISKGLLTILFFYSGLILFSYFFAAKFLHKSDNKFSKFFSLILYLQTIFLFLAIVGTYKVTGQIDFVNGGITNESFGYQSCGLLLFLYLVGLFLSILLPCYLLYHNINLNPLILYVFFFLF